MDKYLNSFCRICGTEYHRCNCRSEESWRKVTDTPEHYQLFIVIRDYVNEVIDADKANGLLNKLDLTNLDTFRPNVKEVVAEIRKKATPVQKQQAPIKQNTFAYSNKQSNHTNQKNNYNKK